MMDNRLESLEIKLAFLEDTIDRLNEVVIKQRNELDSLREEISLLKSKNEKEAPEIRDIEPPPHY